MDANLIGYLLGALDEPTRLQVEQQLRDSSACRDRLAALRQALAPLNADRETAAPPPDLAERTLAHIAQHADPVSQLPRAPALAAEAGSAARSWWRRADVLVAACLLLMISGVGLTLLGQFRTPSSQALIVECKYNLFQFYVGLQQYHDTHGHFPDVAKHAPRQVAGMVVPLLIEAKSLPASASIRCPANGPPMSCGLTLTTLSSLSDEEFARRSPTLSRCYAYSLGYRDDADTLYAPGTDPNQPRSQLAIMADRPPMEGLVTNSVNHGQLGQNVLFCDGHISFLPGRTFGQEDDIFLNALGKVAAGVGSRDTVLGASAVRP